jgi:hypothetical protein
MADFAVTPVEIIRFNKAQLRRAKKNLLGAQERGDRRATANLQRKIAIYEHTINIVTTKLGE